MQMLTKNAIQKIQRTSGHVLSVEDFEDIEQLDILAQKMNGVSTRERRLLNSPFELCGIKFYPLTVAKSLWFTEKCEEWEVEGAYQEALLFWLLTLPLTAEVLDSHTDRRQAEKGARQLSRRLHCSHDEITKIYHKCVGVHSSASTEECTNATEKDYGGTIACLIKEYGGTPDQWLYETPVDKMASLFDQFEKRVMAEEDASRSSSASKGQAKAPQATSKLRAFKAFRDKAQMIEEKWSAHDGD